MKRAIGAIVGVMLLAGLMPASVLAATGPDFTVEPGGGQAGAVWGQQPSVAIKTGKNIVESATGRITLSISSGTGTAGAVLTCAVNPVTLATLANGVASFSGCQIDLAGSGYRLTATWSEGGSTNSNTFTITSIGGTGTKLGFIVQPARGTPSGSLAVQPSVAVQNAGGATVTNVAPTTVTLVIGANPGGAALTCNGGLSRSTSNGVAAFSGCRVDKVGVGYTLTATATALTSATSGLFDVADRLAFTTQPVGAAGGVAFTTQPIVAVRAGASATATHDSATSVTLSIKAGTGAAGAVLTCTGGLSKVVSSGVATFAGCAIDKASPTSPANPYILVASASGLTSAESTSFAVTAGPATKLVFNAQPGTSTAAQPFPTQPIVAITDAGGNIVTTGASSTRTVTLALGANPGGGVLTCTGSLSKVAVAGIATFAGCAISKAGVGYTLVASSGGLTSATSLPFNVVGGANLTITNSASVITWGGQITITVRLDQSGANRNVLVQGTRDGVNWSTVTTLNTGPSGTTSFFYTPVTNLWYRANFAGTAFAAISVTAPTTNVPNNSVPTPISIGTVTGIRIADIGDGDLTITLPANYFWETNPTLTATATGTTTVSGSGTGTAWTLGVVEGGLTDTVSLAFSGGVVSSTTGAGGPVTLEDVALPGGAVTVANLTAGCANGAYGTSVTYCANVTERPADGSSYIQFGFFESSASATILNITVTGGQFIGGLGTFEPADAGCYNWTYPRTTMSMAASACGGLPFIVAGDQLFLASSTAGTASVTISYSSGTITYDSTESFTFTSASINVPSTALSTTTICSAGAAPCTTKVSSPASAPKTAGNSGLTMETQVKDSNGAVIASGVSVEWTISGPAFFTTGGTFKSTANASGTTGYAGSDTISSTGAGGTATITTTIKYLGVSYVLADKKINFVGDPATITASNGYYSLATNKVQGGAGDGAIEVVLQDANKFDISSGATFVISGPTPAAFWTVTGQAWDADENMWDLEVTCGPTAGTSSANIKATVGTKSVTTTTPVTITCATPLTTINLGTMTVDTSAGTTVAPGGQLAISVTVKDVDGLPAPDGTIVSAATNGFGTIVRVTKNESEKGTVNGVSKFLYLAPSTPGTVVVTFFGQGNTTPSNISVTIRVGATAVTGTNGSHLGLSQSGSFSTATKIQALNGYVTWKLSFGAAAAGQSAGIWIATKNSAGVWSSFTKLTGRTVDSAGDAYFHYRSASTRWISIRGAVGSTFTPATQARWR